MSEFTAIQPFLETLPFDPDAFQKDAMAAIAKDHSVVVCAPTGSGKTLIAEYAAFVSINRGHKLFYTTPLKALSNQKFHDLKQQYGEWNVGLLTGDISINRDARLLVMTTEIFRNMLYGVNEDSTLLSDVRYIILDECHYMNDSDRGTVWEESIIYCPETIQIIALSATIANSLELTDWINEVHHDTRLILSDYRPVPLRFSYYDREKLLPLFEAPGKLNKKLKLHLKGNRFDKKHRTFKPNELILEMHEREMLPAIFFTFSRKDCDKHLKDTLPLPILTATERQTLKGKVADFLESYPFLKDNPIIPMLENGFAAHHAGLLPGVKVLVELLFQEGLIKAVFATETLAAGINMPARSTVITSLSKRTNDGHRLLNASEFLQMSGRAGRRGKDPIGYVVVVSSPYEGAREAAVLASSPPDPLNSQFTPTYGMVLNLLQKHALSEAEFLISKSFGQFTAERRLRPIQEEIEEKTRQLKEYLEFECPYSVSDKDFHHYLKSHDMLVDTFRFMKTLKGQIKRFGPTPEILQELRHEEGKKENLLASQAQSPCQTCDILRKHQRIEEKIQHTQKQLKYLNTLYQSENRLYWQQFLNLYKLLKEAGYVDALDKPSPTGILTSQIRTENEFYLTELIINRHLSGVDPAALAALICSITNDSTRENLWSNLHPSPATRDRITEISRVIKRLRKLQERYQVEAPLNLNPTPAGLVEAWAQGLPWDQLIHATNIAEGDLVRLIRRTADLLRQMARIPEMPTDLAKTARNALDLVYREPVKEVEAVEVDMMDVNDKDGLTTDMA